MNAKPRERPVSRSSITFADSTVPAWENSCCKSSLEVWNERFPTYSFIDIFWYLFLLSGVKREALNQVCFDETEPSEENERSNAQLSNFYEFENQPAPESSNAELSLARAHHR